MPARAGGRVQLSPPRGHLMRSCQAPRCDRRVASRYAAYCEMHKRRSSRHGHPEQEGVTAQELKPYRLRVRARIRKNANGKAWAILRERWNAVLSAARQTEATYETGRAYARHDRQALQELLKLDSRVPLDTIIETVLAMYMLQQDLPHRLKSDAAFDFQLARRVRALTDVNAGEYW